MRLHECTLGTAVLAVALGTFVNVFDTAQANPDFSGQLLYNRSWVRVGSFDYRIGSFNTASGAYVSAQLTRAAIASGADYEVHDGWSADDLDKCLDQTILDMRIEQEVGMPSIDGAKIYAIDGAASPHRIVDFGEVYFYAAPDSTTNRQRGSFDNVNLMLTATGTELRLNSSLLASQQLVIDAFLQLTLGAADVATINIPDRDWLLWGAAARAYDLLIQSAPGQDSTQLEQRRAEAARAFSKKSQRWQPGVERKITLQTSDSALARYRGNYDPF